MPKIEVRLLFAQGVEIEVTDEQLASIRSAEPDSEHDFNAINFASCRAYEAATKQSGLDLDWSISDAFLLDEEGVPVEDLDALLD